MGENWFSLKRKYYRPTLHNWFMKAEKRRIKLLQKLKVR